MLLYVYKNIFRFNIFIKQHTATLIINIEKKDEKRRTTLCFLYTNKITNLPHAKMEMSSNDL